MSLLVPNLVLPSCLDLTPAVLDQHGLKAILLDADNTLVPRSRYTELTDDFRDWISEVFESGRKLCVLSNSRHVRRVAKMVEPWGIPAISLARKPMRSGFRRALKYVGTEPHETAMVGDQLFTDILGGNRMGMFTVMVHPITPDDFVLYWPMRHIERRLMRRWNRLRAQASGNQAVLDQIPDDDADEVQPPRDER